MRQVLTREFPTKFLGLVSIFQIWDFCGYSLNTPRYLKMGICYFFLWVFSPFDLKVQSPPRDPLTFSPYHVVLRLESGVTVIGVTPRRRLFLLILLIVDCSYEISLLRSLNFEVLQAYVISLQLDSFSGSLARNCVAASKHSERPARSLRRHGSISGRLCYHGWVEA